MNMIKNSGEFKQRVKISSKVIQAISLRKAMNLHTSQGARQTKDEGLIVQNSSLDKESCFILTDDNHSSEEATKVMNNEMISQHKTTPAHQEAVISLK